MTHVPRKLRTSLINKRVRVPTYTDAWMKGDRYGKVLNITMDRKTNQAYAHVMLDKSNRTLKFLAEDCETVNGEQKGDE